MTPETVPALEAGMIQGKLTIPPLTERHVERPRLERRLAALIGRHRIVEVSATAGAGKTTGLRSLRTSSRTASHCVEAL
jgi:ATP/maltotriose-dependent transcriptional regulator MalT